MKGAHKPRWLQLLETLHEAIPADWQVLVMADRGLYAKWLYKRIVQYHWHPFLRINIGCKARPERAKRGTPFEPLIHLVPRKGTQWSGRVRCFSSKGARVCCTFGDRDCTCVLWTGVGDFQIEKEATLLVTENLGLPRRAARGATINPVWLDPVATFGMETGMVSPFLPPSPFADRHPSPIAALIVQAWSPEWEASKHVAISLSLYESLIVPLCALRSLLQNYYASKLPSIPRLFLS